TEENLAKGFHTKAELEYMLDDQVFRKSGTMSEWPYYFYEFKDNSAITGWTFSDSLNPRSCQLETQIPKLLVSASENPLLTFRDIGFIFHAEYETPVPIYYGGFIVGEGFTTTDKITLSPCPSARADDILQERTLKGPDGLEVTTSFYWPKDPSGPTVGYTAPLVRWKQTVIKGLTSTPITLTSYFSQTYAPSHHNFTEKFIFDPFLDPNVPHYLLTELRDKEIRMILVDYINDEWGDYSSKITFYKDSSAPTVTGTNAVGNAVEVQFSTPLDPESVKNSFVLKAVIPGIGYGTVAGKLEYDGFSAAKFTPNSDLLPSLNYTLTLTGAEDLNGNPLDFNGWSFTVSNHISL
ncbi:MAG: Ig-like domain-containing protein, partial [Bacteroidetes bacterium]|nr:Ig-like domain-containing protein [Bacteroidota bacterium]